MAVGKVIKGDSSPVDSSDRVMRAPRQGVVSAEDYEAKSTAKEIVAEAQRKRDEILADAQRQRDILLARSREEGRQLGLAQVSEQIARAKLQAGEMLAQHEQDVIALACKLAEKIIGRDLERSPEALVEMCATAVENVRAAKSMILRLHPKRAATLREHKKELMDLLGRAVDIAVREDGDLNESDCVIQTEFGTIDASVSIQLEILRGILTEQHRRDTKP